MSNVSVTGMVISTMPMGEYDRRVEILTTEFGRISAFASGARKPNSSLVSPTRVFAFGTFELYQGKNSYNIHSAVISNYFDELSRDMELSCYGFYFLELARYFSRENVEASLMLKLIYLSLRALTRSSLSKRLLRSVFELKMLEINGLCPSWDRLEEGKGVLRFAADMGNACKMAIRFVIESDIQQIYSFKLVSDAESEFIKIVEQLMRLNVDKQFKSLSLLDSF